MKLPPETTNYTILPVQIPLPQTDIFLAADLYQPLTTPSNGTILVQGPYGRPFGLSLPVARIFAARGYTVLFVSVRGTGGSGGIFDPMQSEIHDAPAVVAWMRAQSWYTGTFATLGMSYLGFTQWALMASEEGIPKDMAVAVLIVGPHDFHESFVGTGAFAGHFFDWSDSMATQLSGAHPLRGVVNTFFRPGRLTPVKTGVPLLDSINKHFQGGAAPWLRDWVAKAGNADDPLWAPMRLHRALERVNIPVLLVAGWQDLFLPQQIAQYERLVARGRKDVALTVGPWTHMQVAAHAEQLGWLEEYLAKKKSEELPAQCQRKTPVRIHVTGAGEWRDFERWPPATKPFELYLGEGKKLTTESLKSEAVESFLFDPHAPTPTMGGPLLYNGGVVDDSVLAKRADVLVFTSTPLDRDIEVLGRPTVMLSHSSDNSHVDLFVRLSEVDGKRSRNVTEVYKRLDPNRCATGQTAKVELQLIDCAHRFKNGTSVRLLVAGGWFPSFISNLGTGEDPATGGTQRQAKHSVHFGGANASKLVLPVGNGTH